MPIYREKKAIFVHVPKTGGQTIEFVFRHVCDPPELYGYECDLGLELSHLTACQIRSMYPKEFSEFYKFSLVRNPWERLVSEYFYRKRDGRFPYIDGEVRDFDHFIEIIASIDIESRTHLATSHLIQQHKFLYDGSDLLLDFVGRYEHFERDVTNLMNWFGIIGDIPHINSSSHHHYSKYYTSHTRDLVAKMYSKDIRKFGYCFEQQ